MTISRYYYSKILNYVTPVVFIFLIVIVLGVYFVAKMKNKKDRDVQQGTGSTSVRGNEAQ